MAHFNRIFYCCLNRIVCPVAFSVCDSGLVAVRSIKYILCPVVAWCCIEHFSFVWGGGERVLRASLETKLIQPWHSWPSEDG